MNAWLLATILFFSASFALGFLADTLNLGRLSAGLPAGFEGVIDEAAYARSIAYQRDSTRYGLFVHAVGFSLTLAFLIAGGLGWADRFVGGAGFGPIGTGLLFVALLSLLRGAISLPFSIYDTFVIEQRHGMNRTTPGLFVADLLKGLLLGSVLGGAVVAGVLWFFHTAGARAWLEAWAAFTAFQLLLSYFAPAVLLPLFNRFEPLAPGALRSEIEAYARAQGFQLSGIFTMDGSRRSARSNAFFTGFGRFRRLVLFDTLVERHSVDELVAVVAHEVGHFKRHHILKGLALSIVSSGAMFYALSLVVASGLPLHVALVVGVLLFSSASRLLSVVTQALSRKHEYEADAYSIATFGKRDALALALRKLSRDNLSHLTPHAFKVWVDYSHPPVQARLERMQKAAS